MPVRGDERGERREEAAGTTFTCFPAAYKQDPSGASSDYQTKEHLIWDIHPSNRDHRAGLIR